MMATEREWVAVAARAVSVVTAATGHRPVALEAWGYLHPSLGRQCFTVAAVAVLAAPLAVARAAKVVVDPAGSTPMAQQARPTQAAAAVAAATRAGPVVREDPELSSFATLSEPNRQGSLRPVPKGYWLQ